MAELPGFTRGLDFYDRYAFIGLSQVRYPDVINDDEKILSHSFVFPECAEEVAPIPTLESKGVRTG